MKHRMKFTRLVVGTGFTVDKQYDVYNLNLNTSGFMTGINDDGSFYQINHASHGNDWRFDEWAIDGMTVWVRS